MKKKYINDKDKGQKNIFNSVSDRINSLNTRLYEIDKDAARKAAEADYKVQKRMYQLDEKINKKMYDLEHKIQETYKTGYIKSPTGKKIVNKILHSLKKKKKDKPEIIHKPESGRKPRRVRKLFKPKDFGVTEWKKIDFGAYVSPYHGRDFYNTFRRTHNKILDSIGQFSEDKINWDTNIITASYGDMRLSDLFFNLFENGKFSTGTRGRYYQHQHNIQSYGKMRKHPKTVQFLRLIEPPSFPQIEMVTISVPQPKYKKFRYINDPDIHHNDYLDELHVIPDVFSLEVMFKGEGPKKEKRGLVFPLSGKDSRIPEQEESRLIGDFFFVSYQKKRVYTEYHNVYNYFESLEEGIIAAINHKRFYRGLNE